jgi:hypothetical protein
MKVWSYPVLLLFLFITASPASMALTAEKMLLSAPSKTVRPLELPVWSRCPQEPRAIKRKSQPSLLTGEK